jgi:hypothetical protein
MSEDTQKKVWIVAAATTVLVAAIVMFAVAPAFISPASAAIQCTNPGGGHPQGNCQGANEFQNPAGKAPAGQNK